MSSNDVRITDQRIMCLYSHKISDPHLMEWQVLLKKIYKNQTQKISFPGLPKQLVDSDDLFTTMQLESQQGDKSGEFSSIKDLLTLKDSKNERCYHLIISGLAGMGKTTLLRRIAYLWAVSADAGERDESAEVCRVLGQFELVFLLNIRKFKPGIDLWEPIINQFTPHILGQANMAKEKESIGEIVRVLNFSCLFLFDGLDEMSKETLNNDMNLLDNPALYNNFVIVSSRPHSVESFCHRHHEYVKVGVLGFDRKSKQLYIEKFFECKRSEEKDKEKDKANEIPENADELFQAKLQEIPILETLSSFPILLAMMCIIWEADRDLPQYITGVYESALKFLQNHCKEKHNNEHKHRSIPKQLGEVALACLFDDTLHINSDKFNSNAILENGIELGLISTDTDEQGIDIETFVEFMHRTWHEYCAAVYWVSLAEEDIDKFRSYLFKIGVNNVEAMSYLLRFCCGLSTKAAEYIIKHLARLPYGNIPEKFPTDRKSMKGMFDNFKIERNILEIGIGSRIDHWTVPLLLLFETEYKQINPTQLASIQKQLQPLLKILPIDADPRAELRAVLKKMDLKWLQYVEKIILVWSQHNDKTIYKLIQSLTKSISAMAIVASHSPCPDIISNIPVTVDSIQTFTCGVSHDCTVMSTFLNRQKHIKHLSLESGGVDCTSLFANTSLQSIEEFHLDAIGSLDNMGPFLSRQKYLKKLSMTCFTQQPCTRMIACVTDNAAWTNLQEVELSNCACSDHRILAKFLSQNQSLNLIRLEKFTFKYEQESDNDNTISLQPCTTLEKVILFMCSDHIVTSLREVLFGTSLVELNVTNTYNLSTASLERSNSIWKKCVEQAVQLPHLRVLNLNSNSIGSALTEVPERLVNFKQEQLTELNLSSCKLTQESWRTLSCIVRGATQLQKVDLSDNEQLNETVYKMFGDHIGNTKLKILCLRNTGLTDQSLARLPLQKFPDLLELYLHGNKFGTDGIKEMVRSLEKVPRLERLDLGPNSQERLSILEKGLLDSELLRIKTLDETEHLKAEGVEAVLKQLQHLKKLQYLELNAYLPKYECFKWPLLKACWEAWDESLHQFHAEDFPETFEVYLRRSYRNYRWRDKYKEFLPISDTMGKTELDHIRDILDRL